jgi:hypothetical protein
VDPWSASWTPAIGDDVESLHFRSGTIIGIRGDLFEVEYDLVVDDVASDGSPSQPSVERETGWHSREDLSPGHDTLQRLIRDRAAM